MKKALMTILSAAVLVAMVLAPASYALTTTAYLTDFESRDDGQVSVAITGEGTNQVTFDLGLIDMIADIRGFFFNFAEGTSLSNFTVTGDDVTSWDASGNVTKVTNDVSVEGTQQSFYVGIEIGTQGMSPDDIRMASFTIFNDSPIYLGDLFGARLTSVGDDRQDSRKMIGTRDGSTVPHNDVPEPATLLLLGTGLIGLAGAGRKLKVKVKK